MKKHFLLLMMAFVSLTGWAQIDIATATAGATPITYGDASLGTITVRLDGTLNRGTDYEVVTTEFYTTAACTEVVKVGEGTSAVPATVSTLPAGEHYVKITGKASAGFSGFKGVKLTVNKAPLHLSIATQHTVYGTPFTVTSAIPYELTYDATSPDYELKNGETLAQAVSGTITAINCTNTAANKTATGGNFTTPVASYDVTVEGLTSNNYELTISTAMDIWQRSIVDGEGKLAGGIAITASGNTAIYNRTPQTPVFTVSLNGTNLTPAEFAENFTVSTTDNNTNVGTAKFTITAKEDKNFAGSYIGSSATNDLATYTLTINPAVAIVKAKDQTRVFDGKETKATAVLGLDADQFEWTGIFEGDAITGTPVAKVHADIKNAGETTIDVSAPASPGFGGASNYTIGFDNTGVYKVTKKALTITADDKTVGFGEEAPALTATITGYVGEGVTTPADAVAAAAAELAELQKGVSAKFVDGFVFSEKAAGEYANVIEAVVDETKAAATFANYTWTLAKGKLTIGAAQILIAIKAAKKTYGDADPEDLANSVTVTGATAGLLTPPTVKRAPGEDAGTYLMSIDQEATAKAGYEILYTSTPVNFTIEKAALTIKALTQIMSSKTDVAAATAALDQNAVTFTGLKGTDTKADILYSLAVATGTTVTAAGTQAGKIEVTAPEAPTTPEGVKNKNYTITVVPGDLVISGGTDLATIELPADATLMDILNYNDGAKVNAKVQFTRNQTVGGKAHTWAAEKWNTLVLPFDIKVSDLSRALGYAIVNVVDPASTTEKNVMFKLKMSGTIEANTPFVVKTEDALADAEFVDADGFVTFNNVTIKKPASAYPSVDASTDLGYKFVGAYQTKAVDKNLSYLRWLFGDGDKWVYVKSSSDAVWNIVPFAAYVDLGEANVTNAPSITFTMEEIDGTKTAIKSIDAETVPSSIDNRTGWYTIGGMKLQGAPTQKGIYIQNGKKVVVK